MELGEALYKQLSTATLTTALGSTAIYPLIAPQGKALPYVLYQGISEIRMHAMGSDPGLQWCRYQISYFSSSYKQMKALADKGRTVLQDFSGDLGGSVAVQRIFFDNEVDLSSVDEMTKKVVFHTAQDYLIWYST